MLDAFLRKLDTHGQRAASWSAVCGLVGIVAFALVTIIDVLLRWLFNSPIDGVADTNRLMVAVVIASLFPMGLAERRHVTITFLGGALGRRVCGWLDLFGALLTTAFFVLLSWKLVSYTRDLFESHETTWLLGWPVGPWWTVVTAFMFFCAAIQIIVLAATWRMAWRGNPDGEGASRQPVH